MRLERARDLGWASVGHLGSEDAADEAFGLLWALLEADAWVEDCVEEVDDEVADDDDERDRHDDREVDRQVECCAGASELCDGVVGEAEDAERGLDVDKNADGGADLHPDHRQDAQACAWKDVASEDA